MSHPGVDQIFKIEGRKATVLKPDSLNAPNGITWDATNGRFLLAPFSGTAVQTWKPGDKTTRTLVERTRAVRRDRGAGGRPSARVELGGQRGARRAERIDVEARLQRECAAGYRRRHETGSRRHSAVQRREGRVLQDSLDGDGGRGTREGRNGAPETSSACGSPVPLPHAPPPSRMSSRAASSVGTRMPTSSPMRSKFAPKWKRSGRTIRND